MPDEDDANNFQRRLVVAEKESEHISKLKYGAVGPSLEWGCKNLNPFPLPPPSPF